MSQSMRAIERDTAHRPWPLPERPWVMFQRCADIHHGLWPLQPAEAELTRNTVAQAHGIQLPDSPPVVHYADRQDTLISWPAAVRRAD